MRALLRGFWIAVFAALVWPTGQAAAQYVCPSCCDTYDPNVCVQNGIFCSCNSYCAYDGPNGHCKTHFNGCICGGLVTGNPWGKTGEVGLVENGAAKAVAKTGQAVAPARSAAQGSEP